MFSGDAAPANLDLPAGSRAFSHTVDHRQVIYVVPDPAPASPAPLMIVLDYLGGNPSFMANLIKAGAHAAQGEVLAFPAHQGVSWNNGVESTGGDPQADIDFLGDVIADAVANLPVEASKISMTGYSEGGFMADLFACKRPGLLTGFGMVGASQLDTTQCETGAPLKMIDIAGTADREVPYDGYGKVESAATTLSQWQATDGCSGQDTATTLPAAVNDGTSVIRHQLAGCQAVLYEIVNGGHTWPGAEVTPSTTLLGTTSQNLDATQVQWEFFAD
ncbi:MAG: hypothetical protein P4L83_12495 [Nevskia sp.]|nr:hypothetical protein [Nevskia sp.]